MWSLIKNIDLNNNISDCSKVNCRVQTLVTGPLPLIRNYTYLSLPHVLLLINFIPCTKPSSLSLIFSLAITWIKSEWVQHYGIVVKLISCLCQLFSTPKFRQIIVLLQPNHPQLVAFFTCWFNIIAKLSKHFYVLLYAEEKQNLPAFHLSGH